MRIILGTLNIVHRFIYNVNDAISNISEDRLKSNRFEIAENADWNRKMLLGR